MPALPDFVTGMTFDVPAHTSHCNWRRSLVIQCRRRLPVGAAFTNHRVTVRICPKECLGCR